MISFFRKIRQSLISENKTANYLKYALGEILLVVIGILIALQINNWNEHQNDLDKERQILSQLVQEFKANQEQLDQKIEIRKSLIEIGNRLLEVIDHQEPIEKEALLRYLSEMWNDPTFNPVDNQLLTAEHLRLIRNQSLRNLLTSWSSGVAELNEIEYQWADLISERVVPFWIQQGISRDAMNSFWTGDSSKKWMLDASMSSYLTIGNSQRSPDADTIRNAPELEGLLALMISYNHTANLQSMALQKQIVETLDALQQELKK